MQIRELSKPVTAKKLNESLAKTFGYKLNLEQFTDVQLEDVRNKLRTEMSQFEVNESFDNLHSNAKYQKTRALLDVINQAILEREEHIHEGSEKCSCEELGQKECPVHSDDEPGKHYYKQTKPSQTKIEKKSKNESYDTYFATVRQKAMQHSVPSNWINSAIQRMTLGESDQEELAAELTLRYDLTEDQATRILYLAEGEEDKAKIIMATKDMVDRITGWLEDTAAMKAEQLLELLDSIRENQGSDVAQAYQEQVKPALEAIYTALETSRQGLSGALAVVSGGEAPTMGTAPMGAAPMGAPAGLPGATPDMGAELPPEAGTPAAPELGREKRESVDYSRRLGMLLASKKN
jgi:hypothetical protein